MKGLFACALALSTAAHANTAADAADLDAVKDLASVNVTANKVEQNLLEVPASISVIDAATLDEKGIHCPGARGMMGSIFAALIRRCLPMPIRW